MSFTETWLGSSGVYGTAGWNLYGTNGHQRAIYSTVGFVSTIDGLQASLGSGRPYEARMYTWHGMTAQGTGPFAFAYRAASDGGTDTWLETAYMVGASADGSSWLYIIDGLQEGTSRTYGWAYATQQFGSLSVRFGTTVSTGDWGLTGLTMNVTYGGSGTWHGTWTGTKTVAKAGTYVTLTATLTPGAQGTWFFQNNISAVLVYSDSDSDVLWQNASFTLPYANVEEDVRDTRLAYVGTWNDGSSVGYLPLGTLLVSCSDITYYAHIPFESRAWAPSMSVTLNDYYNSSTGSWLIQDNLLGGWASSLSLGSLVLYAPQSGTTAAGAAPCPWRYYRMFSGPISEPPAYNYAYKTCDMSAQGALAAYVDKTFDITKAPWTSRAIGTWGPLVGIGTYTLTHASGLTPSRYTVLYPTGSSDNRLTVKDVVSSSRRAGVRSVRFTTYETTAPAGCHIGAAMTAIDAWPTPAAVETARANPRWFIESLLANVGLSTATGRYTPPNVDADNWGSWTSMGVMTAIPTISPTDGVVDTLNEICAALGIFYTTGPMGALAFFAPPTYSGAVASTNTELYYSSPKTFVASLAPAYGAISVNYGFDQASGEGPRHALELEYGAGVNRADIASRFAGDPIAAIVAGWRVVREYGAEVPRWSVTRLATIAHDDVPAVDAKLLGKLGAGCLLNTAPTGSTAEWRDCVIVAATYRVADDMVEYIAQAVDLDRPWVSWGSSVADNGTSRWF